MPTIIKPYHSSSTYRRRTRFKYKTAAKKIQRAFRKYRKAKARPTMALSKGYKGSPNQYRFFRETRPVTIDLGNATTPGVSHIAGTGTIPNISVFKFPAFKISDLVNFTEFSALFANYKIDSISTTFIPQWTEMVQSHITPLTAGWSASGAVPNLMITRVNTKYLPNGFTLSATAEAQRDQLAQLVKKSRSLYGTKKWLKVYTKSLRVTYAVNDGAGGTNLVSRSSPWLPTLTADDQEYRMNDLFFADKIDGTDNTTAGIYKYRMYHKVNFRCSFLG